MGQKRVIAGKKEWNGGLVSLLTNVDGNISYRDKNNSACTLINLMRAGVIINYTAYRIIVTTSL